MTGSDKRKLLIVGKSKDPRCFRGQRVLPVTYTNSGNAWMTGDIFRQWLKDFNRDMGRQKRKILLLIDNCSAHPQDAADHLPNIQMEFLPPNTTSVIQPCDQGIIRNLKGLYRREVVRKIIADIDDTTLTANEMARKLSLLDAVHLLSQAWTSVKQQTIANCYRAAGFTAETGEDPGDEIIPPPPVKDHGVHQVDSLNKRPFSRPSHKQPFSRLPKRPFSRPLHKRPFSRPPHIFRKEKLKTTKCKKGPTQH